MGGGGGTSIATTAMQALPIGFPKVCVTTLACGDTHEYVGTRDIILFPSIVDISGINQFSRLILSRAAGAVCGMMEKEPLVVDNEKPIVCLSMFGNSTAGVEKCAQLLKERGCEPLIFHATGGGGRSMEELIEEGHCQAVLDTPPQNGQMNCAGEFFPRAVHVWTAQKSQNSARDCARMSGHGELWKHTYCAGKIQDRQNAV